MSERITLEQLKAMDADMVEAVWLDWQFPFDEAACGRCVTGHHDDFKKGCRRIGHNKMRVQITRLGYPGETRWARWKSNHFGGGQCVTKKWLRDHVEELYALRLFYDHLYPQPASEPAPREEAQSVRNILSEAPR